MVKARGPAIPRRTTRSSCFTESTQKQNEAQETNKSYLSRDESNSLDNLLSCIPGRKSQVLELLQLIGPSNSPMLPLFVYGGPSTGKTSVVIQVLRHLKRPYVYSSFCSCFCPKILFDHIFNQLSLLANNVKKDLTGARSCEKASDFVSSLKEVLTQFELMYLVFDSVDMVRRWDQSNDLTLVLFKLHDLLQVMNLGIIYISSSSPDSYYSKIGSTEPLPVFFPDYTEEEIYEILTRNQANPKLYSSFLRVALKPFYRVTRRLDELSIALQPLFKKYCEQLADPTLPPDETMNRKLYDNIQPHIGPSMNEIVKISTYQPLEEKNRNVFFAKRGGKRNQNPGAYDGLDFHMSLSSKYLLLSAFLASKNPPTLDSAMFDSTGGSANQKRKRKSSEATRQEKEHNLENMVMMGPGSFSLERLLAIFQCITFTADLGYAEELSLDQREDEDGAIWSTSDVLLQLASLCNTGFICRSSGCSLEGFTRYRCTVNETLALKVARSISFPLSKYLYRG
ncbi:origin recognition complex protein 5 isoform X2 [Wolffia australiana]